MTTRGSRIDWLVFLALGFLWGSSYLFIKIGVDHGLQPFTLIMFRLAIGLALLATVVAIAREPRRWPRRAGRGSEADGVDSFAVRDLSRLPPRRRYRGRLNSINFADEKHVHDLGHFGLAVTA